MNASMPDKKRITHPKVPLTFLLRNPCPTTKNKTKKGVSKAIFYNVIIGNIYFFT
jgi:hypothetical protein